MQPFARSVVLTAVDLYMPNDTPPAACAPDSIGWLLRGHVIFLLVCTTWLCSVMGIWFLNGILVWSAGLLYVIYDTWLIAYVSLRARAVLVESVQPAIAATSIESLTVAVIVAARNEAGALPATLNALLGQADRPDDILLVDDGSIDGSHIMLAEEFGLPFNAASPHARSTRYPNLRILRKANTGKADSLNQALQLIDCDVVITLDADTVLDPAAIGAMRSAFGHEPQLAAACGVLRPLCRSGISGRLFQWFQTFEYLRAFLSRAAWMRAEALLLVSGAFAGYRRQVLERLQGFDPACLVEDYELIHRLHRYASTHAERWSVRVLPAAIATTDAPNSLSGFLRQRRRWFAGFLQTQYKNRDMTGNPRYGNVGRFMLPLKVIDTLQPVFGLTAFVLLVSFLVGSSSVLKPVLAVIIAKIVVDFCFQLWAVQLYHRWIKRPPPAGTWLLAVLASFAEPFSFQLMRHSGALLGWLSILTGRVDWQPQRPALVASNLYPESSK
jgi:cellulose synthase/poly-beta-1,6-N-acetylglucosamine synthase-like glycosyltransferase